MRKLSERNILFSTATHISHVSIGLLCVLFTIFLTPLLARNVPNVILLGLMGLFALSLLPRILHLPKSELLTLLLLVAYIGVELAYKVTGKSSAALYYYFNTIQFFFFIGAILCIYGALSQKQVKTLVVVPVAVMLLTMVSNVVLYLQWGDEYVTLYQTHKYTTNSVNTPFSFAVLLLSAVFLVALLNEKRLRYRLLEGGLMVFCLLFISVIAQRAIAILLAAMMLPLLLLFQLNTLPGQNLHRRTKIILLVALLVCVGLAVCYYDLIIRTIGTILGDRILKRFEQIILFLETGSFAVAGGSLLARFHLLSNSWRSFTRSASSFLFGIGDHRINNYFVGNHSLVLDQLARYGIVFSALCCWLMTRVLKQAKKIASVSKNTKLSRQFQVFIVFFVLRAFLGTVFDVSISITMFVVTPLAFQLIQASPDNTVLNHEEL